MVSLLRFASLVALAGVLGACSDSKKHDDATGGTPGTGGSATSGSPASGGAGETTAGAASGGGGASGGGETSVAGTGGGGGPAGGRPACERPPGMPAVTLTYDDALPTQLATVKPALAAHMLEATFFLTDVRNNLEPWAALRDDGHELASHTFKHPCPKANTWVAAGNANEDYDVARMTTELDESIAMLTSLGQPPPYTFAYPCGITWIGEAQESYIPLIEERFVAARGVSPGLVKAGVNLANVPATFSTGDAAALIAIADNTKATGAWVVFGFHGVGGDSNAIAAEPHEALLAYLDEHRDDFYVATFGQLAACLAP